jgi:hypothetical protein
MKDNVVTKLNYQDIFQESGKVIRKEQGKYIVQAESGDYRCKRAASCLLEPQDGDWVLLTGLADGSCYVLAILEREDESKTTVQVEGDLHVQLPQGRMTVAAQEGIHWVSGKDVSVTSAELNVQTMRGNVVVDTLSYVGTAVRAEMEKAKLVVEQFDGVFDRVSQKAKRVYRFIEEFEQLRAERLDYVTKKNMSFRGKNALMTAEELVKIDGEQIHVG